MSAEEELTESSVREVMDLETARKILEEVKSIPETAFTESSDLSRIGKYSLSQIRQAFVIVAVGITGQLSNRNDPLPKVTKLTPYGEAKIVVKYTTDVNTDPYGIWLSLSQGGKIIIDASLDLEEIMPNTPGWKGKAAFQAFQDDRNNFHVSALEFYEGGVNNIVTFRKLFRGLRWVAANLLDWNGDQFILPEQLDTQKLPPLNRPKLISHGE